MRRAALLVLVQLGLCLGTAQLGTFWLWSPRGKTKSQLLKTAFAQSDGGGTRVAAPGDSVDETLLFDVPVPGLELYADAIASGKEEMRKLLRARLQSESVTSGTGGAYKVWLSPSALLVALRVFPVGYRVFVLRHDEDPGVGDDGDDEGGEGSGQGLGLSFSVVDLERGLGSQRCTIMTKVSLFSGGSNGGSAPVKVSLHCVSRRLDRGLKKRLLAAVREAWTERLSRDVGLCAARLAQLREHSAESLLAGKERRRVEAEGCGAGVGVGAGEGAWV